MSPFSFTFGNEVLRVLFIGQLTIYAHLLAHPQYTIQHERGGICLG
jgi:hypothetical protein